MNIIRPGHIYYHTSYKYFERVDLRFGKKGNDFGRGFYLTSSEEQADRFVNAAIRKSGQALTHGYVLSFKLAEASDLAMFEFATTDAEWLHCICAFRSGVEKAFAMWEKYDILAGKVANDDTNATISFYLNGAYGEVGSDAAVAIALAQLRPDVLKNQICVKTDAAASRLEFIGAKEVAKHERAK
jgi:hypothetical protein